MKPGKSLVVLPFCLIAATAGLGAPAAAHPGHLAEVAGHGHWVAGAAIAIGIALSIWGALTGRREDASEAEAEGEGEEAAAEEPAAQEG